MPGVKWPLTWPSPSINSEKLGRSPSKVAPTMRCTFTRLPQSHADKPCTLSPYLRVRPTTRYTLTCVYCGHLSRVKPTTLANSPLNPNTLLGSYARGTSRILPLIYEKLSRPTLQTLFQSSFRRQVGKTPACLNLRSLSRAIAATPACSQLRPLLEPCRDNSPYPSTLFQELSRQPLYALCIHFCSEDRPDKPVYFRMNSCLGVKPDKPVRSYSDTFWGLNRQCRYTLISIHLLLGN